jgi:hypothetical protein
MARLPMKETSIRAPMTSLLAQAAMLIPGINSRAKPLDSIVVPILPAPKRLRPSKDWPRTRRRGHFRRPPFLGRLEYSRDRALRQFACGHEQPATKKASIVWRRLCKRLRKRERSGISVARRQPGAVAHRQSGTPVCAATNALKRLSRHARLAVTRYPPHT